MENRIENIKSIDYGYGQLEDKLISLFTSDDLDFETAALLIDLGADVNAEGKEDDENLLSEILSGEWYNRGEMMIQTIEFFLKKGFDVNKKNGRYGAQCLWTLTLSTFDRNMIIATKLLLDAGAKNISISSDPNDAETPWDFIGTEGSYQECCCHDHHLGNIYEAVYQIYQSLEDGRDYSGIDSYEKAIGHKIIKILSAPYDRSNPFFDINLPGSKHRNCFTQNLFFITDNGVLLTTQYTDFWFDSNLPDVETIDVSEYFMGIVGDTIKEFKYGHNDIAKGTTHYGQPIVTIVMKNGHTVTFTNNFGEVSKENRVAYYSLQ